MQRPGISLEGARSKLTGTRAGSAIEVDKARRSCIRSVDCCLPSVTLITEGENHAPPRFCKTRIEVRDCRRGSRGKELTNKQWLRGNVLHRNPTENPNVSAFFVGSDRDSIRPLPEMKQMTVHGGVSKN